jgi:hypothetical protein
VNLTEFSKNSTAYASAIADTVTSSFSLTSSEQVNVTKVHFPSISSSSVMKASVLSFRKSIVSSSSSSAVGSVTVNYTVSISSKSHNFTFFSHQLQQAISSGHFTFLLQINALQYHAYGFRNASSSSISIVEILSSSSSSTPIPSDNNSENSVEKRFLLPIIIGGCIVICFLIIGGYLFVMVQRWRRNKLLNKIHIDGIGTDDDKS